MNERRRESGIWVPTISEVREALGGKLPSVFEQIKFDDKGLVITPEGPKVPIYVASGLGFNQAGTSFLKGEIIPKLESLGAFVFNPFEICAEFIDPSFFDEKISVEEQKTLWQKFNRQIGVINYGLAIPRSKIMFAILEGHPPDEGAASEIPYMVNFGPVVGVRTDFRLAENPATGTNPAITYFMQEPYRGGYFEGQDAYERGYELVGKLIDKIITS